jgi:DNA-binding NarL/FixJ family response regulator
LPTPVIRVLVVDDFEPWRGLLRTLLRERPEWQIVCEVSDGLDAVREAGDLQPDLILLDIGLPGLNGIEAARRIRALAPTSRIVFVTENYSADMATTAMTTGAYGYVLKSDAGSDLVDAVEAAVEGRQFVSARLALPE